MYCYLILFVLYFLFHFQGFWLLLNAWFKFLNFTLVHYLCSYFHSSLSYFDYAWVFVLYPFFCDYPHVFLLCVISFNLVSCTCLIISILLVYLSGLVYIRLSLADCHVPFAPSSFHSLFVIHMFIEKDFPLEFWT